MERNVYFIQHGIDGPIKIGAADDPNKRLFDLQVGTWVELRLLATIDNDRVGGVALERRLHGHFASAHIRGEWFWPTYDLWDFIRTNAEVAPELTTVRVLRRPKLVLERTYDPANEVHDPRCKVCVHPNKASIEQAIIDGLTYTEVDRHWSVPRKSVASHYNRHMGYGTILPSAAVGCSAL